MMDKLQDRILTAISYPKDERALFYFHFILCFTIYIFLFDQSNITGTQRSSI